MVKGEIGDIETIGQRYRPFGQHVNETTSQFVALPRGDYEALWAKIEELEGHLRAIAGDLPGSYGWLIDEGIVTALPYSQMSAAPATERREEGETE